MVSHLLKSITKKRTVNKTKQTKHFNLILCLFIYLQFFYICFICFCQQKNPSTIRQPEEDRGRENYTMTAWVELDRSKPISRHVSSLCSEAADSTYVRDADLKAWAEMPGNNSSHL